MVKTNFEKAFERMSQEQRRKTGAEIDNMLGLMTHTQSKPKKEHKK